MNFVKKSTGPYVLAPLENTKKKSKTVASLCSQQGKTQNSKVSARMGG